MGSASRASQQGHHASWPKAAHLPPLPEIRVADFDVKSPYL